jgi:hypothetical protein
VGTNTAVTEEGMMGTFTIADISVGQGQLLRRSGSPRRGLGAAREPPETLDLTTLAAAPTIAPDTTATTDVFTIGHRGKYQVENFNTFAAFVSVLATDLTATSTVVAVAATGQFNSTSNTFTATRITVLIND